MRPEPKQESISSWRSLTDRTPRRTPTCGNRIAIGVVRGTHSLDGRVKVESYSGETAHFSGIRDVVLSTSAGEVNTEIVELGAGDGKFIIVRFDCAKTIEQAERLRGADLWVEREYASPVAEGEYYLADLCRCEVFLDGRSAGIVLSVMDAGDRSLLEVQTVDDRIVIVPFVEAYVGAVDIDARRIDLTVGWILE